MNKVKYYRELLGWSQTRLAKESKVSRQTIIDIENGKRIVTTSKTMGNIAGALGKKVSTIFLN